MRRKRRKRGIARNWSNLFVDVRYLLLLDMWFRLLWLVLYLFLLLWYFIYTFRLVYSTQSNGKHIFFVLLFSCLLIPNEKREKEMKNSISKCLEKIIYFFSQIIGLSAKWPSMLMIQFNFMVICTKTNSYSHMRSACNCVEDRIRREIHFVCFKYFDWWSPVALDFGIFCRKIRE